MKKLITFVCMAGLLATASCKDDDSAGTPTAPDVTYDGIAYTVKNAYSLDYGQSVFYNTDGVADAVRYNMDFYLTDGTYSLDTETSENATMEVFMELYSPGGESFKTGTFNYIYDVEDAAEDAFVFEELGFTLDSNNNNIIEWEEIDQPIFANAGMVTVSGSGTNYTIAIDVTLENGKKLKASYSGNFTYVDKK